MKEQVSEHLPLPPVQGQALVGWGMLLPSYLIPRDF